MNRMLLTALIVGSVGLTGTVWAAGDPAAGQGCGHKVCHVPRAPMVREPKWVQS